jgi:dCTP deaminase
MILTGAEIQRQVLAGNIVIDPFNVDRIGPNSYDFSLGSRLITYTSHILDSRQENHTIEHLIPPEGMILSPNKVFLINTEERIGSDRYVPIIRGRSSIGRLGVFIHITADIIDLGSVNQLTLQLYSVIPVRIYPGILIGQVTFWIPAGDITLYRGKYGKLRSPAGSLIHLDASSKKG